MALVYLVRHGKAAGSWESDLDPGLDDVGREQAEAMAATLTAQGPLPLVTSPLRRTRETAAALERHWGVAKVDPRIGEIPSPPIAVSRRGEWLRNILQSRWSELDQSIGFWRAQVLNALGELIQDTVVVSHFVAINVAVGHTLKDDRVTCFRPENCSCTVLNIQDEHWKIVVLGVEGESRIF
ncbi:MAG TPA: histidine phosphatase family protein [Candidatus Angelobacter sp.]|jgi:broad specificity phosphatase PhoE|nr:histidine phosphatase family protein [Candidatus Angelobacter sp.]